MARSKSHYIEGSLASSEDCNSLQQVRREIDRIDREIMERIGQRARYVEVTARFKTGEMHVAAPQRQAAMLAEKRQWAGREGLDPAVIEDI